jgi:hypothetical protein
MPQEAAALRDFNAACVGLGSKGDIAAAFEHVRSAPLTGRRAFMSARPSETNADDADDH